MKVIENINFSRVNFFSFTAISFILPPRKKLQSEYCCLFLIKINLYQAIINDKYIFVNLTYIRLVFSLIVD